MGAHSAPTTSRFRNVAVSGLIIGGASFAGAGVAHAQPALPSGSEGDIDTGSLDDLSGGQVDTGSLDLLADAFAAIEQEGGNGGTHTGEQGNASGSEWGDVVGSIADQISDSADNPSKDNSDVGVKALEAAKTKIGAPYVWGGNGPDAFDCSGLTSWAYKQAGVTIPRTAQQQANQGTVVDLKDIQIGDLVTFYEGASHVGIYAGDGQVLNAPTYGVPVSYAPIDSMPIYNVVRFR